MRALLLALVLAATAVPARAQISPAPAPTTGVDCGCAKTGTFVAKKGGKDPSGDAPALDVLSDTDGRSPSGKYTTRNGTTSVQIRQGNTVLHTIQYGGDTRFGFSPDDDRFLVWSLQPGSMVHLELHDVTKPAGQTKVWQDDLAVPPGAWEPTFSPEGKYVVYDAVSSPANGSGIGTNVLQVIRRDGVKVAQRFYSADTHWGFSPDDDRFAVWSTQNNVLDVFLHDLTVANKPATSNTFALGGGGSRVMFSPHGTSFVVAALESTTSLRVKVLAPDGAVLHNQTVTVTPGAPPGGKFNTSTWGFGPDAGDRSFYYEYTSGPNETSWTLVNLAEKETARHGSDFAVATATTFSPCGDVMARIVQRGNFGTDLSATVYRTNSGETIARPGISNSNDFFRATSTNLVKDGASTFVIAPNTAANSCAAPAPPVLLESIAFSPATVTGGTTARATVTLTAIAPVGGLDVVLTPEDTLLLPDTKVRVIAGQKTATFDVPTRSVDARTTARLTASYGRERTASVALTPPRLVRLDAPDTLVSGRQDLAWAELDAAPAKQPITVALASANAALVSIPASVSVPKNERSASVQVQAARVGAVGSAVLSATWDGVTVRDTVVVRPAELAAFTVLQAECAVVGAPVGPHGPEVVGGGAFRLRVALDGLTPVGGGTVALAASLAGVTGPGSLFLDTEAAGVVTFTLPRVTAPTPLVLTASYRGRTKTVKVLLVPAPMTFHADELGAGEFGAINRYGAVTNGGVLRVGTFRYPLPVTHGSAYGYDVNGFFEVSGAATAPVSGGAQSTQPTVWRGGRRDSLASTFGAYGIAYALNDAGRVAGYTSNGTSSRVPTSWDGAAPTILLTSGFQQKGTAFAVSPDGRIAGDIVGGLGGPTAIAVRWDSPDADAAFLPRPSGGNSEARGVNAAGTVVGWVSGTNAGARWGLGAAEVETQLSYQNAINAAGYVAGTYGQGAEGGDAAPFSYAMLGTPEGRAYNLNCLLSHDLDGVLTFGRDLNDDLQVLASGTYGADGQAHGFLLTPDRAEGPDVRVQFQDGPAPNVKHLAVTSAGTVAAQNVVIEGMRPDSVDVASSAGPCVLTPGRFSCALGTMPSISGHTVIFTAPDTLAAAYVFLAGARLGGLDRDPSDNLGGGLLTVRPAPTAQASATLAAGQGGHVATGATGFGLTFTTPPSTDGALTVRRYAGAPVGNAALTTLTVSSPSGPLTPDRVLTGRYWTVETSGLGGFAYTACLDVTGFPGLADPAKAVIVKRETAAEAWRPFPTTLVTQGATTYLCASGLTAFSEFALGAVAGALPVELAAFTATADGAAVRLVWTTASEQNNAGFAIEARGDAAPAWREVAFVPGHGTSAEAHTYAHAVTNLAPGRYTFRLRQVDLDGTASYSPEAEALIAMGAPLTFALAGANPAHDRTVLALAARTAGPARVEAFDALGRRVAVLFAGEVEAGRALPVVFDAAAMPAGVYLLVARAGEARVTVPVTITH